MIARGFCLIDADCFGCSFENATPKTDPGGNAQKNSGGGIAPAANWGVL
jgi:hypothetical protein